MVVVAEAEKFTRPIAIERAAATPEQLEPKLPEVRASMMAERLGFWASIIGFVTSAITGIAKAFGEAVEWLNPLRGLASEMPWQVWVFGALVISASIYYISRKSGEAKTAAVTAYQEGKRV